MKVTRSDLRVRIMTILYQINIYEKDKISYDVEEVIKEVRFVIFNSSSFNSLITLS